MKKAKVLKTKITKRDIAQGWAIVRGMVDAAEARPIETVREKMVTMKQIKLLVGTLIRPPLLKGAEKGAKRTLAADLAVITDISKFGSLPKAIKGHMRDGRLSRTTTERSHYDRIRPLRKSV